MKLSVLNLAPVREGQNHRQAIESMTSLAQKVEEFGYERFWIAEHHNMEWLTSSATQLLIQHTLSNTSSIRVGSGGVMLPNHSPYLVAEQYGTLETLYPGRVDLGLGRAPGTDPTTAAALRRNETGRDRAFPQEVKELLSYFSGEAPVQAYPARGLDVPVYILGSSINSAHLAAHYGLPYSFAAHFAPGQMEEAVAMYRENFQPSEYLDEPYVILGANVVLADTVQEADYISTSQLATFVNILGGQSQPMVKPVESEEEIWDQAKKVREVPHFGPINFTIDDLIDRDRAVIEEMSQVSFVGDKEKVAGELKELKERVDFDELMAVSYIYDQDALEHSHRLLAELVEEYDL